MKKDMDNTWELDGFSFADEEQARKAEKELEGVKYIRNNTDLDNPDMVLEMYNRIIDEKLFATPVGYAYLKEMQEYLTTIPYIMNNSIRPIPVEVTSTKHTEVKEKHKKKREVKPKDKSVADTKVRNMDYRRRYKTSFTINVILILIVAAMFAITLTSGSTTILNYENKIIDKYEQWEMELKDREADVSAREAALEQE